MQQFYRTKAQKANYNVAILRKLRQAVVTNTNGCLQSEWILVVLLLVYHTVSHHNTIYIVLELCEARFNTVQT